MEKWCVWLQHPHCDPQGSKVIIPLHVQLTGEDQWFRVNISCPLIKTYSERTRLIPTREWKQLRSGTSSLTRLCFLSEVSAYFIIFVHFINQNLKWHIFLWRLVESSEPFIYKWCHGMFVPVINNTMRVWTIQCILSSPALPRNCDIHRPLRVNCGPQRISGDTCNKLGCCYDAQDLICYYRLDSKIAISIKVLYTWKLFFSWWGTWIDLSSK